MQLDPEELRKALEAGDPKRHIRPVFINDDPFYCRFSPYEYMYASYSSNPKPEVWLREEGDSSEFSTNDHLKISSLAVEEIPDGEIKPLNLEEKLRSGKIRAFFPLHDPVLAEELKKQWFSYKMIWNQDLNPLRKYFGAKIGLYFRFVSHYSQWLRYPALLGIPCQVYIFVVSDYSNPYLPIFSFLIAIWNVMMLEYWKRAEKTQALEWGMIGFEDHEVDRPEFKHQDTIVSYIDGSQNMRWYPESKRTVKMYQSGVLVFLMIVGAVSVVAVLYVLRAALQARVGDLAQTIISVINAIQIYVFNYLYGIAATSLTKYENHRTDTEHEDSLIGKFFAFQFVNSYSSFFYIAFIAQTQPNPNTHDDIYANDDDVGECGGPDCMLSLATNLGIIFGTQLAIGNIVKYGIPYSTYKASRDMNRRKYPHAKFSEQEEEYFLIQYDPIGMNIRNYTTIAIQFGYMSLFITALPIAGVLGLLCNAVNLRFEVWSLLTIYQRAIPRSAEDIGTWQVVFTILMVASVITNAGLAVYTMRSLEEKPLIVKFWVFVGFQWACFTLQAILMALVPDVPVDVEIQIARNEFVIKKVIEKVADDDDDRSDSEPSDALSVHLMEESGGLPRHQSAKKKSSKSEKKVQSILVRKQKTLQVHKDFDALVMYYSNSPPSEQGSVVDGNDDASIAESIIFPLCNLPEHPSTCRCGGVLSEEERSRMLRRNSKDSLNSFGF